MPLIAGTEYREFIDATTGAALTPTSGDPHDSIIHAAMAVNADSRTIVGWGRMMQNLSGNLRIEPLAWLGNSIAIYADEDPFWAELSATDNPQEFLEKNYPRLPVALFAQSRDALRLAAFLTALHAFVDQSAPGLTRWETLNHNDQPYVAVRAVGEVPEELQSLTVFYAATPGALTVTLNEDLLKRAIDRQLKRRAEARADAAPSTQPAQIAAGAPTTQPQPTGRPWLGSSLCLQIDRRAFDGFGRLMQDDALVSAQAQAWSNITILNQWKQLLPEQDPVAVHERLFGVRLVDPAGGTYTWNEQWQTMASVNYGHPGQPKVGPAASAALKGLSANFGLTLENNGLRARAQIDRESVPR
jgi:hypothetical protein